MVIFLLALLIWFVVGALSFIFWWTKDFDLTSNNIPSLLVSALIGPLAFYNGWLVHIQKNFGTPRVLMKRKKSGVEQPITRVRSYHVPGHYIFRKKPTAARTRSYK
jgi:hypothetical protein